jgi:signal transduction histidine kinase
MLLNSNELRPQTRRRRVLAVDDDSILLEVMTQQFAALGWDVAAAENGRAALAVLARENLDLAVIDLSMPELDGFGLLQQLRQNPRTGDLPAIVCTSHNDSEAVERAYRLGASSFLTKPINWPQFLHHAQFVMRNGDTERALRLARTEALAASRTKSTMLQVLSHEMKTPIAALVGLTNVIGQRLRGHDDASVVQHLEHVVEASQQLNSILNDVMLLGKAVSGGQHRQFEMATLDEILTEGQLGLKAKAARRNVHMLVRPVEGPVRIMCDLRLIHQAVQKLVDNAIKFSFSGGTVELWGHVRADGTVIISVKDQGPGLTPQKLKDCLQPFVQENTSYARPAEGLGLGLPIAKAICEAHGGELAIQTAAGHGLLAAIVLPSSLLVKQPELKHA